MKYFLAHDAAAGSGDTAAKDVFSQLSAIEGVLSECGHETARLAVGLDFITCKDFLSSTKEPAVVFNLVESLAGSDRLQTVFAMFLEEWGIPFTGSGSQAMLLTNHKILSKSILGSHGIPFPACCGLDRKGSPAFLPGSASPRGRWIIKPLEAHASLHLNDDSVGDFSTAQQLSQRLRESRGRFGMEFFAERFIEGREFNLSVVEAEGQAVALPPAEIAFIDFPPDKPKIVGYAAKWDESSIEYVNTPRTFGTLKNEPALAAELSRLALRAWDAFGLAGYARVDFRVDPDGQPYVLEANANPCLSPDAGMAAAAAEQGWSFRELCLKIIAAAHGAKRNA